jgi:hypothetical protein
MKLAWRRGSGSWLLGTCCKAWTKPLRGAGRMTKLTTTRVEIEFRVPPKDLCGYAKSGRFGSALFYSANSRVAHPQQLHIKNR